MARLKPPVGSLDHLQGNPDSPVILVEYGDFQCPHCGAAYPVVKQIEKTFKKQLAMVFRHFPLSEAHPFARAAAIASEAASVQGKFWEMHDLIYDYQSGLNETILFQHAETLKLDLKQFEKDMNDQKLSEKVEADFESGIVSGVNGTPSFFMNGIKYNGNYDYFSLSTAVLQILS